MKNIHLKTAILSIVLIVCFNAVSAANFDLDWGPEYKMKGFAIDADYLGSDKSGYYLIATSRKRFGKPKAIYMKYDHSHTQLFNNELEMVKDKDDLRFRKGFRLDGQDYAFSTLYDYDTKTNTAYLGEINSSGTFEKASLKELMQVKAKNLRNQGSLDLVLSKNEETILIYGQPAYDKKEDEQFFFQVLDNQLNELWNKEIELPYEDKSFGVTGYDVDNKGNVYVIGKKYKDKDERVKGEAYYDLKILMYYNDGNDYKEYNIELGGNDYASNVSIDISSRQGFLVCTGFYSDKDTRGAAGAFFMRVNSETTEVEALEKKEFDTELRQKYMKKKHIKKGKTDEMGIPNFYIRDVVVREDGGGVMVGEQYRFWTTQYYNAATKSYSTTRHYLYGDIVFVNFSPEGTIDWLTVIPKSQYTTNDGGRYSSFVQAISGNQINIIYGVVRAKKANRETYLVNLDKDGEYEQEALFNIKESEVAIIPRLCEQTEEDKIRLFGVWSRKKVKFGTLTLN